jgi:hypothetical protein
MAQVVVAVGGEDVLAGELVPALSSLEPVYGAGSPLDEARLRFGRLGDRFRDVYGARPALFARSPGPSPSTLSRCRSWLADLGAIG